MIFFVCFLSDRQLNACCMSWLYKEKSKLVLERNDPLRREKRGESCQCCFSRISRILNNLIFLNLKPTCDL